MTPRRRIAPRPGAHLLLAALLLGACQEREFAAAPEARPADPVEAPAELGTVTCTADVQRGVVECGESPASGEAQAGPINLGGQGHYVRLVSSNVAYNGSEFTFNVTVQNLSSLPLGTDDGATRHATGLRVFIAGTPGVTGSGTITVNGDGLGDFTGTEQPYYQYGGTTGGVDGPELGADGILATGEVSATRAWSLSVPPTVTSFTFQALVATRTPTGTVASVAPQVTGVTGTITPGQTVTLTGTDFHVTPASNTVRFDGIAASVTGGDATSLQVVVPCVKNGAAAVQVSQSGMTGAPFGVTVVQPLTTVATGEAVLVSSTDGRFCTELASAGGSAEYLVSVFSTSTSPASAAQFQFSGVAEGSAMGTIAGVPVSDRLQTPTLAGLSSEDLSGLQRQLEADAAHARILEGNIREAQRLSTVRLPEPPARGSSTAAVPPLTRNFRVANIATGNFCGSFYVVAATRVYYDGKIAIYEDDATPVGLKYSDNPAMAGYYQAIGDQYNDDMEPVIREHFGDPLMRDDETDNDDVLVALFTPRINNSFSGVAGFVVSCDQRTNDVPVDPGVGGPYAPAGTFNGASNFGQFFYAYQPTVIGTGYASFTPDNWYRTIRSTFIHETKHVVSMSARFQKNPTSPTFENAWLEEGTARHAEELWGRKAVDNIAWEANTGYGSAANPINMYCDARPSGWPECTGNPRRPANIMSRHFTALNTHLLGQNARLLSPFGATASDTQSYWYAISWSFVRYVIDRYALTEEDFLLSLTDGTSTGVTNLAEVAGASIEEMLHGWNMSLVMDDNPNALAPDPVTQLATWNMRNIYAGLNTDFPSTYPLPYPQVPTSFGFGGFNATAITTLRGGGALWYRISGTQTATQLLQLRSLSGGAVDSNVRMSIVRLQ